jgi:hypothetical protein
MLAAVKVLILYTYHFRRIDPKSGALAAGGIPSAGCIRRQNSFPLWVNALIICHSDDRHRMHALDEQLCAQTFVGWSLTSKWESKNGGN